MSTPKSSARTPRRLITPSILSVAIATLIEAYKGTLEVSCFSRRGETRYVVVFRSEAFEAAFEEESAAIEGAVHALALALARQEAQPRKLAMCIDVANALEAE